MLSLLLILLNICTGIFPEPEPVSTNFKIDPPLHQAMYLSGNFGELRNNHFHSGLDIKAQSGTPVYSVEDGFISRVSVSPYGYGLAVYIDHPGIGVTTVYGHLSRFAPFLDKVVRKRQYEQESFSVNLFFNKDEIKIKKGQVVAYSGNTGSSGGPHLHFEIRETISEYLLDPMPFLKSHLKDTRPPQIRSIAAFPVAGVVNNGYVRKDFSVIRQNNGTMTLSAPLTAWGKIILGVKAYDYMNETTNIYGVYSIRLYVDDKLVYSSAIDRYSFDKSRAINSFIDYEDWVKRKSFIMRSYVAPGNYLTVYKDVVDQGIITIDQERNYKIRYELRDRHGNLTTCIFPVKGVKRHILMDAGKNDCLYSRDNYINMNDVSLYVPKGALYEDVHLKCSQNSNNSYVIEPEYTSLHTYCNLKVKIPADTLENKKQYYLARIAGDKEIPYTGEYKDGYLETKIRELGTFSVKCDVESPVITPVSSPVQWGRAGQIRIRIGDKHTGVESFRGEIDGKFVLFEMDGKTSVLSFKLDPDYVVKNKSHHLKLTVADRCGNQSVYENSFYW